jgi:hypothetical protein
LNPSLATEQVQQAIDHMSTLQYLRHRASVRDQITTEGHMKEMTETMNAMKQQLDATQVGFGSRDREWSGIDWCHVFSKPYTYFFLIRVRGFRPSNFIDCDT